MRQIGTRLCAHFAAASAAVVATSAANAEIIHWADANIVCPTTFSGVYINVETRTTATDSAEIETWHLNLYSRTFDNQLPYWWFSDSGTQMLDGGVLGNSAALSAGTLVGPDSSASGTGSPEDEDLGFVFGTDANQWQLNASNYFGFSFLGSDGGRKYAWGRMVFGENPDIRTIVEFGYDDSGAAIAVGAVAAVTASAMGAGRSAGGGPALRVATHATRPPPRRLPELPTSRSRRSYKVKPDRIASRRQVSTVDTRQRPPRDAPFSQSDARHRVRGWRRPRMPSRQPSPN